MNRRSAVPEGSSMHQLTFSPMPNAPLYRQLYEMLLGEIRRAGLAPGERLPSRRALAAHLGLSINTVDSAYQMLVAEGYVQAVPKSGYYVCPQGVSGLVPPPENPQQAENGPPRPRWQYDFAGGGIDASLFPLRTWERISRDVMRTGVPLLNQGDVQGDECLRRAVARYLHEYRGARAQPSQVIIGAGSETLLGMAARLLDGGKAAVEDPGFAKTTGVLRNAGLSPCPVSVDEYGICVDELERSGCCAACVTPSHQFPTGVTMPAPRRAELLQWARAGARTVIEDDYDSEFRFDGRPIPALQGLDGGDRVIYLSTFSRSLAPAIRVAYMVLPERLLPRWQALYGEYASTVSRFEQHTLSRFMEEGHFARHINRIRSIYRSRRDALVRALTQALGKQAQPLCVHTGLHMPVRIDNGMTESELVASAAAQGVRVRALGAYRRTEKAGPPTVVLSYGGLTADDIEPACALLARAWKG